MIQWRNGMKKWHRIGFTTGLGITLTTITLFVLWSNVEAGLFGGGAGNCGNFGQAARLAQDGDVIVQMTPPRDSGGATITENLRISGGWFPTQNCDENNQYFTETADYLAWGFEYVAPIQRSELNWSFGTSVLSIENPTAADFPRLDRLVIENLIFDNNSVSVVDGGGIIGTISNSAEVYLDNVILRGSDVSNNGAGLNMQLWGGSSLLLEDTQFVTNTATNRGGGFIVEVGAGSKLTIENNQFVENEALIGAGFAAHVYPGGELLIRHSGVFSNRNTLFNGVGAGGYLSVTGGLVSIANSSFVNNDAGDSGGGLYIEMNGGNVVIENSVFEGNSSDNAGGGLYIESVGDEDATVWLINTHFENNTPSNMQFSQTGSGSLNVHVLDNTIYLPAVVNEMSPNTLRARIISVTLAADFTYQVYFETENFEPDVNSQHVHFFFDTVKPQYAGTELCPISDDTQCKWKLYGGSSPFTGYSFADRPFDAYGAEKICVLVADPDHSVRLNTGNCVELP